MDLKKTRKQKSRRRTEAFQGSGKLVDDEIDEVVPPIVSGEIFGYLARMINPEQCSTNVLHHSAIKLIKVSTSSSWVEFFLVKKANLKNCGYTQNAKRISLDPSDNLPAYVIQNKIAEVITNPHTSSLYSKFSCKIQAYSALTQQILKLYSTACIPLSVILI